MDNENQPKRPSTSQGAPVAEKPRTLATFLESSPPDVRALVSERATEVLYEIGPYLKQPDIQLHCETCDGIRTFGCTGDGKTHLTNQVNFEYLIYVCRNCRKTMKTFALAITGNTPTGPMQKLGELPTFGPPTPPRVFRLIGEDYRELFLKGRRAELRGLGVGAYAYYRRIVEHQKGRIIDEIRKVAEKLGATAEMIEAFRHARVETQFAAAIDMIKTAIPQSVLIDGHNPLTLLHGALSAGLHEHTDEECLELATSIRVVLVELADRIATALKEEAALKSAVSKLLNRKNK